ncbi:SPASM domain-containing protein [Vibrio sp. ZSDZ65]|uniref:SPASM domain-containing protein n=1 Tax=Vibrio qingdaonensis TaxID=2829491 RepID=A0A9X3CSK2_9VIBR|nr:radical SAM protein [Vibrio qingdaonensis]MCW8348986.1 SPASM domain-containing protein [Vibrio qingdaonensis]
MAIDNRLIDPDNLIALANKDYKKLAAHIIGSTPKENMLSVDEVIAFDRINQDVTSSRAVTGNKLVAIVKVTRKCNLRCKYCVSWSDRPDATMSFSTMVTMVKRLLSTPNIQRFEFIWHGGEVTLLKPEFFRKLIWVQQTLKTPNQQISNSIQTNALSMSNEWITFIKGIGLPVGVSFDGSPAINDRRRVDINGRGCSDRIIRTLNKLKQHHIQYGALMVVDREITTCEITPMLSNLVAAQIDNVEFLNYVPSNTQTSDIEQDKRLITYREYISFLSAVFKIWWQSFRDELSIPLFEDIVAYLTQETSQHSQCYWDQNCAREIITVEPNGDITACDKYLGTPGSVYGSILKHDLATLYEQSEFHNDMIVEEQHSLRALKSCEWFQFCRGGCSHDRINSLKYDSKASKTCCGSRELFNTVAKYASLAREA